MSSSMQLTELSVMYIKQKGSIAGPTFKIPLMGPFIQALHPKFDSYLAQWASGPLSCVSVFHKYEYMSITQPTRANHHSTSDSSSLSPTATWRTKFSSRLHMPNLALYPSQRISSATRPGCSYRVNRMRNIVEGSRRSLPTRPFPPTFLCKKRFLQTTLTISWLRAL